MRTNLSVFRAQKLGNEAAENEDASEPDASVEISVEKCSIAISDGATESSFASQWAQLLVTAFVNAEGPIEERSLTAIRKAARIWRRVEDSKALPWYAEEKRKRGAFATFLGTYFNECGTWESIAVGDSCFFKVNSDRMVDSFPIDDDQAFGATPPLVSSRINQPSTLQRATGNWAEGDLFLWMTDAAAQWFLHEEKAGQQPWNIITSFDSTGFLTWLSSARASRIIRNDDITILMLKVP